jgi:hypothetical protein
VKTEQENTSYKERNGVDRGPLRTKILLPSWANGPQRITPQQLTAIQAEVGPELQVEQLPPVEPIPATQPTAKRPEPPRRLIGNGFPSIPTTIPPASILAGGRPDPFAGFPRPASIPPNPIPNYLIPATGDGNYPIGARLTERELSVDSKAVADAGAAHAAANCTPWPKFIKSWPRWYQEGRANG